MKFIPFSKGKMLPVLVLLIAAIGATVVYTSQNEEKKTPVKQSQTTPEQAFKNYLTKTSKLETLGIQEDYTGTGATIQTKGVLDTKSKKYTVGADIDCTVTVDGKPVTIKSSIQVQDSVPYTRITDVSGVVNNYQTTKAYQLTAVYAAVQGVWYKNDVDQAIKTQMDNGIYVYNSSVIAPGQDSQKIVDALISKNVFTITSSQADGDKFILKLTAHKDAYLEVLKEVFPSLSNPDLIMDNIFDKGSTQDSTLTIDRDGNFVSEKLSSTNLCTSIVENYVGNKYEGIAKEVNGTSLHKDPASIKIDPITTSKPVADLQKDVRL